jgi:hypothetical protein
MHGPVSTYDFVEGGDESPSLVLIIEWQLVDQQYA